MRKLLWLAPLLLVGCRTGGVFQTAKGAICGSIEKVEGSVTTAGNALGIPGTVVGGVVNAALGLLCGASDTVITAAAKTTEAVIEKPAEAVGLLPPALPEPVK